MTKRRHVLALSSWTNDERAGIGAVMTKDYTSPEKDGPHQCKLKSPVFLRELPSSSSEAWIRQNLQPQILKPVQQPRLGVIREHPTELLKTPSLRDAPSWAVTKKYLIIFNVNVLICIYVDLFLCKILLCILKRCWFICADQYICLLVMV